MSLITRCPNCDTMFKVVADQLKIAQGWVRCGHCSTVFDASAQLLANEAVGSAVSPVEPDLEAGHLDELRTDFETQQAQHDALHQPDPEKSQPLPVSTAVPEDHSLSSEEPAPDDVLVPLEAPEETEAETDADADADADFDPAAWKLAQQELAGPQPGQTASGASPPQTSDVVTLAALSEPELDKSAEADFENPSLEPEPASEPVEADAEIIPEVSFVRDARRKAFWQRRLVRGLLALLLVALSALLVLQWMLQNKDRLAVLEPSLVPVLQALCVPLACELKLPRQVESLVIDSSTFNKLGIDTYRLDFVLKNTGASLLEVPSLELTLTDSRDQAIVRRVLKPSQFGVSAATLAAHSELAGAVSLKVLMNGQSPSGAASLPPSSAAPLQVAGYRILAFYP